MPHRADLEEGQIRERLLRAECGFDSKDFKRFQRVE